MPVDSAEIRPYVVLGMATAKPPAFICHGAQDRKLKIHFARDAYAYAYDYPESLRIFLHYLEVEAGQVRAGSFHGMMYAAAQWAAAPR